MKQFKTIFLNQVLALVLTIAALLAGQNAWAWDGEGTSASPWLIKTTGDLVTLATNSKPNDNRVGIFGRIQSACTIRNLIIDQASITGYTYVGVLVGETSTEGGNIENCFVINSSVTSNYTSDTYAGIISGNYWSIVNYSGNCYCLTIDETEEVDPEEQLSRKSVWDDDDADW